MSYSLYTPTGQAIQLGRQLGAGGEGVVYEVEDQPFLAAKRYHEVVEPAQVARLRALVERHDERLAKIAAWPTALLHDGADGPVAGFLMPRVDGAAEVHALHSPKSRLQKFPDATWAFLIHTATNIARAVATMHAAGFVIGDVNPKNILVTRQAMVALLDCDSYQFEADGTRYVCAAGFPEYTPPELHGVVFREVERTVEHDAFGLAVVIFQLLFLGRHPFAGKFLGAGEMPLERAIREGRLAYGAESQQREMLAPPGSLAWEALPASLRTMFERSFLTPQRTPPHEWIEALDTLAQALTTCAQHSGHRYHNALTECPWCEIETRARVRLFNFTRKIESGDRSFRLDEIWREIEQVGEPSLALLPPGHEQMTQPSDAALRVAKVKRKGFWLALAVPALIGFGTAYSGGFCPFIGLSWVSLLIAKASLKLEPQDAEVDAAWPASQPNVPIHARIEATLKNAQSQVHHLQQRWDWEINGRFVAKRTELISHKQHYDALEATREDRLRQLETVAKQDLLQAHLVQYEVKKSEISGLVLTTLLRANGMRTAADITPERVKSAPGITRSQSEILLGWRRQKEQLLELDSSTLVHPALRQRVLTETEAMRERLEAELRSGAFYLRRLRTEAEAGQMAVRDQLAAAKEKLAQAEADFKAAGKQRQLFLPILVLLVAGLVGGASEITTKVSDGIFAVTNVYPAEQPGGMKAEAKILFDSALENRQAKNYDIALTLFAQAQVMDDKAEEIWDEWSFTHYLAGRFDDAIRVANAAPHFGNKYRPHKNLGLAYAAKGQWSEARSRFEDAAHRKLFSDPAGLEGFEREDIELRYLAGLASKELGESPKLIEKKDDEIKAMSPNALLLSAELVDLICLRLWDDQIDLAKRNLETLRQRNSRAADLVGEFVNNHPLQLIPKKTTTKNKH